MRKAKPVRGARPARKPSVKKPTRTKSTRRMVPLILRVPPDAIARLRAVAIVRKLTPGRVLAVALRLYERRLHSVLR